MDPDMILGEGWARWIDTQEWRSTPQGSRSQSLLSTFGFLGEFHNEPQLQKDLVSAFLSEVDQSPILDAAEKFEVRAQLELRQIQAYFNIHLDR